MPATTPTRVQPPHSAKKSVLSEIPDPEQNSGQSSASSSRTNSLDRSSRHNYDHIKPTTLSIDSSNG